MTVRNGGQVAKHKEEQHERNKYISYEEPINGRSFTYKQMQEVYRDLANKQEYPDFDCWFSDMLRSGVFETI